MFPAPPFLNQTDLLSISGWSGWAQRAPVYGSLTYYLAHTYITEIRMWWWRGAGSVNGRACGEGDNISSKHPVMAYILASRNTENDDLLAFFRDRNQRGQIERVNILTTPSGNCPVPLVTFLTFPFHLPILPALSLSSCPPLPCIFVS